MRPDVVIKIYSICGMLPKYNSLTRKFENCSFNAAALLLLLFALNVWHLHSILMSRINLDENLVNLSVAFNYLYVFAILLTVLLPTSRGFQKLLLAFYEMDNQLLLVNADAVDLKASKYTCLIFNVCQLGYTYFYGYQYMKTHFAFGITVPIDFLCLFGGFYFENYMLARILLSFRSLNRYMAISMSKIIIVDVEGIAKVYAAGCDVVDTFNKVYGGLLFVQIVTTYLNLVTCLYENLDVAENMNWVLILGENFNFLFAFALLIYKSERIKSEMSTSVVLANRIIQNSIDDKSIQHLLWMLGHETSSRQPRISAAGVFDLGYPLVFTLVNLTATYVIVMYQFTQS